MITEASPIQLSPATCYDETRRGTATSSGSPSTVATFDLGPSRKSAHLPCCIGGVRSRVIYHRYSSCFIYRSIRSLSLSPSSALGGLPDRRFTYLTCGVPPVSNLAQRTRNVRCLATAFVCLVERHVTVRSTVLLILVVSLLRLQFRVTSGSAVTLHCPGSVGWDRIRSQGSPGLTGSSPTGKDRPQTTHI